MAIPWYAVGFVALAVWYLITSFIIQPYLVLRRLLIELNKKEFQGLIANYMIGMINQKQKLVTPQGEIELTLFELLLGTASDKIFERLELWIKAQTSAISRNVDKEIAASNPLIGLAGKFLPKKYKDAAPALISLISGAGSKTASDSLPTESAPKYI